VSLAVPVHSDIEATPGMTERVAGEIYAAITDVSIQ
jgi:hypothetical protein